MADTAEHRAEIHRLAAGRRATGLPVWDKRIRLAGIFRDESRTFEQRRDAIVAVIRRSGWTLSGDLAEAVDSLAGAGNADEFDEWWDVIYDHADQDRVWIETR